MIKKEKINLLIDAWYRRLLVVVDLDNKGVERPGLFENEWKDSVRKDIEEFLPEVVDIGSVSVFNDWELHWGDSVLVEEGGLGEGIKTYKGDVVAWKFENNKCQYIKFDNGRRIDYLGADSWLHVKKITLPQYSKEFLLLKDFVNFVDRNTLTKTSLNYLLDKYLSQFGKVEGNI